MQYWRIILYLLFGILPSLVWLFYYLRKDLHPEPKKMILKIFLWGSLITIPVFFIQIGLSQALHQLEIVPVFSRYATVLSVIKWFLIIAGTEELFKYAVVKINIIKSSVLDEPLDIMLYMVVAALGFAAVENILYLFSPIDSISLSAILQTATIITLVRFIGATFLHTLCSGLVGYFMAQGILKNRRVLTFVGLALAVLLHGLYDFSIITLTMPFTFIVPATVILFLVLFMLYDFDEIKKVKSICKI